MNSDQKKQLATIFTAIASIILSALIAALFSGKMILSGLVTIETLIAVILIYFLSIHALQKGKNND